MDQYVEVLCGIQAGGRHLFIDQDGNEHFGRDFDGVDQYSLRAGTAPDHDAYGELLEWNGPFDPARFVAAQANSAHEERTANMAKKGTKQPRKLAKHDRFPLIEKELHKRTKAELVAMILAIAKEHAVVARELEDRLAVEKPVDLLVADLSSALDRATDFDERMMSRNFDVDWQGYADVQKGLSRLVEQSQLADAKSLALKLMKDGSYQVECSDEGLMSDEISRCLMPVIRAVQATGGDEAAKWAGEMQAADRVGSICGEELAELRSGS